MTRATILLLSLLVLMFACACGPAASEQGQSAVGSSEIPELSDDVIRERINGTWIREVPEENGKGEPISWGFGEDEPKEIAVVEKQIDGTHATIVLDMKTGSAPRSRNKLAIAGQIRTQWELRTGWVLRQWEVVDVENISLKYKDLKKAAEQEKPEKSADQAKPGEAPTVRR